MNIHVWSSHGRCKKDLKGIHERLGHTYYLEASKERSPILPVLPGQYTKNGDEEAEQYLEALEKVKVITGKKKLCLIRFGDFISFENHNLCGMCCATIKYKKRLFAYIVVLYGNEKTNFILFREILDNEYLEIVNDRGINQRIVTAN